MLFKPLPSNLDDDGQELPNLNCWSLRKVVIFEFLWHGNPQRGSITWKVWWFKKPDYAKSNGNEGFINTVVPADLFAEQVNKYDEKATFSNWKMKDITMNE